jgi:hypothetical protein
VRLRFPPLRIHVWGGLGSQLFAVALAHTLQSRFPSRSLILVLHNSGVTRREPEVLQLFPNLEFETVDDFIGRENHDSNSRVPSLPSRFRGLVRRILLFSGLLAEENTDDINRAHRWTVAVRGHYFHRSVSAEFLELLKIRLSECVVEDSSIYKSEITLHYRLGDLLELANKSFVDPQRVGSILSQIQQSNTVAVFSDSPVVAVTLIKKMVGNKFLHSVDYSTMETIYAALRGVAFVGTSSKISYWVVLLRLAYSINSSNYLPREDLSTISVLGKDASSVIFY